jgi:hypothetical protein
MLCYLIVCHSAKKQAAAEEAPEVSEKFFEDLKTVASSVSQAPAAGAQNPPLKFRRLLTLAEEEQEPLAKRILKGLAQVAKSEVCSICVIEDCLFSTAFVFRKWKQSGWCGSASALTCKH